MEMDMDIKRSKLAIVSLFMMTICFWLLPLSAHDASRGITVISDMSHQSGKLGVYKALLIGINDYKDPNIPDLKTAVNDANAMANLLSKRYGFEVKLLLDRDATREAIYRALRSLASSIETDDSVLIYYAGHGDLDRLTNDGWWIPADAKGGNPVTYLNNFLVQTYMRSMKARHVLLISDSCYSGTLFGQARAMPPVIGNKYYLNLYNEKSRWGMTSGNKTPVSDQGSGGHSVFAYQLLKELRNSEKPYISTQELYTRIAPIISNNSEQTPLCRPVRNTGDQGGEFVFVASSGAVFEEIAPEKLKASLSVDSNVSKARVLVDGRGVGSTSLSNVKILPGEHQIKVEKDGYEPYTKRVRFEAGRNISLYVDLTRKTLVKGRLYVETQPDNAKVKILNIEPRFYQGMELKEGRYHVEVSADGYLSKKSWVTLKVGEDKSINVQLTKKKDHAKLYIASGKVKQSWPFAGGSSCCGCRIEHYGTLPTDFPPREVTAVVFYLTGSRSDSYYTRIKSGPNRLKLVMGNRRAEAMSEEIPAVKTSPVKHKWLLTFKFKPPVPAEPGMTWRLLDGDNKIYSAVLLHASDHATADDRANALPGKYKTSSCQYARVDDVWYTVRFDFFPR
jgi:hypothetical protein